MCTRLYTQDEQRVMRNFKTNHSNECQYCHRHIADKDITIDHKLPVSRGGRTIESNLAIACADCNCEKSDMTEDEYMNYLKIKKDTIKNDETLKSILHIMGINNVTIENYKKIVSLIKGKTDEKEEIEKCIFNISFNASQGYMLCKELKNVLNDIDKLQDECNKMAKLQNIIQSSNDKLKIAYKEVSDEVIKNLRAKMNIGHLGEIQESKTNKLIA